jgi:hypothetical protein
MSRRRRFLEWLFREHYTETAVCKECSAVVSKTRMVRDSSYGWFCNEDELANYALDMLHM